MKQKSQGVILGILALLRRGACQFRILRESGVVCTRKEGTQLRNSLRREDIDRRFPGLLAAVLAGQESANTSPPP
jgi:hypothetical protein